MHTAWRGEMYGAFGAVCLTLGLVAEARDQPSRPPAKPLILHARVRELAASAKESNAHGFVVKEKELRWDPAQTAIIICDMWNQHWCRGATRRVGELAPAMNQTVAAARAKGILIIHAPSSCMDAYKNHPARRRAQSAPKARKLPEHIGEWCNKIPAEEQGIYPIDQSDGGCDDGPQCPQGSPWKSQVAAIEIRDDDAISDSGTEIWNLLESRGIRNVMLMGVHTNMCVLGRPFGLRNLARAGKNVVLVRDLTDTMYNSRKWPYVSHFEGTNRIVEHIEKYVGPTIVSTDLTGRPAFQFQSDDRPRTVFLIGEDEYKTEETLPAFANKELEPAGIRCTFAIADPKSPHDFPGAQALDDADLVVLSVRRRAPKADEMSFIRRYIDSGKPLVGIRTASHAFDTRGKAPPGHVEWKSFDPDVLGGHYTNHYPDSMKPVIERAESKKPHPILDGIETPFEAAGSLYKTSPLAASAVPLLTGRVSNMSPEPVAWVNLKGSSRVFYTSLGHPGDFSKPEFCRLLRNAIFWALNREPTAKASASKTPAGSRPASGSKAASVRAGAPGSSVARSPFDRGQGPLPPARPWPH